MTDRAKMRILVCGGRDFDNPTLMDRALRSVPFPTLLITGAQRKFNGRKWIGADWQAIEWAQENEVPFIGIPAKWTVHGRGAGPIRNREMRDKLAPDMVVALPGGTGTADMVALAKEAGIPVREFSA